MGLIPDTNVLVDYSSILDKDIIIPYCVLDELDNLKKDNKIGYKVREVVRKIIKKGVKCKKFNKVNRESKTDDELLKIAQYYNHKIITQDCLMYKKGKSRGINIELFQNNKKTYTGVIKGKLSSKTINDLHEKKYIKTERDLYENQFFDAGKIIARYKNGYLHKVDWSKRVNGIDKPTKRQLMALDVLFDEDIDLVTIFGGQGSGKTTLSLNSAISQVVSESTKYDRIILSRPKKQRGIDEGMGYLPGEIEDKYKPFNAPFYDNLYSQCDPLMIEVLPLASIQGRSLDNAIWIITEFQDISPDDTKLILGRAGRNTKVILEGDLEQHSDNVLNKSYNGLTHVINNFKDDPKSATVELDENKRSYLSKMASRKL